MLGMFIIVVIICFSIVFLLGLCLLIWFIKDAFYSFKRDLTKLDNDLDVYITNLRYSDRVKQKIKENILIYNILNTYDKVDDLVYFGRFNLRLLQTRHTKKYKVDMILNAITLSTCGYTDNEVSFMVTNSLNNLVNYDNKYYLDNCIDLVTKFKGNDILKNKVIKSMLNFDSWDWDTVSCLDFVPVAEFTENIQKRDRFILDLVHIIDCYSKGTIVGSKYLGYLTLSKTNDEWNNYVMDCRLGNIDIMGCRTSFNNKLKALLRSYLKELQDYAKIMFK